MPGCLQFAHDASQSVVGEAVSALHGMNVLESSPGIFSMVMYFSVSSLVHSFSFIVMMFKEELSLTLLMIVKISSVRYGGLVVGASGTSSASTCFLYR